MTRNLVILGSTGSIGRQTLEVAAAHPDRLRVVGLAASKSASLLSLQAAEFHPAAVALSDEAGGKDLEVPAGTDTFVGQRAVVDLLERTRPDLAVLAVVGGAALEPLLWLLANKVQVALANKETLVMAGEIIRRSGGAPGELIRPVDSEHSALWQCLMGVPREQLAYIWLTASGGPFRTWNKSLLGNVSPAQVLAHPTWKWVRASQSIPPL
jgi:1-deoxy-D-xylulose-5-phosphate reductoisomerase